MNCAIQTSVRERERERGLLLLKVVSAGVCTNVKTRLMLVVRILGERKSKRERERDK